MTVPVPKPRLYVHYLQRVRPKLAQQFGLTNPHQVPQLSKIVLNVGAGEAAKAIAETAVSDRRILRMKSLVRLLFVQATRENRMAVVGIISPQPT